jgi:hypothetical protein
MIWLLQLTTPDGWVVLQLVRPPSGAVWERNALPQEVVSMQCRRYLCSKLLTVLITLLSVTISPHVGGAQTASSVTEQDITGLIIATQEDRVSVSAGDTVILDQGRLQGVEVGDRYAVFEVGDRPTFEGGRTIIDYRSAYRASHSGAA